MKVAHGILSAVLLALLSSLNGGVSAQATVSKPATKAFQAVKAKSPVSVSFGAGGIEKKEKIPSQAFLSVSTKTAVAMAMVLAFNSGVINGACLSGLLAEGTKQATAAVTGAWTNSALGMAKGASGQFALNAKCILSYMCGSLISGLMVPNPTSFKLDITGSLPLFALASGLLVVAASLADAKNINYLFLCLLANGISNSLTSTLTANLCRTAHMSGITSDMGTFLGQVLRGNKTNLMKLKTFATLAACFWAGGYVSFGLTESFGNVVLEGSALVHLVFALFLGLKMFGIV
ncbi:membrane protein [Nitzschia inconspicua]|uniref:Membrane protein n=1 Tax=Nitzschia inconspicua TaxID=303405 RepID=A0A9K3Q2B8_9STRA|nr:membrane protein [Nitzschia inconspicua]